MELKDVILSTLAEMETPLEESATKTTAQQTTQAPKTVETPSQESAKDELLAEISTEQQHHDDESELIFLNSVRERLLVLFEGFQAPNNANLEAKIDLTLNFLEYVLASIDTRIDKIKKGN